MSAINDALRRASSAAKSGSASPLPPMPVEPKSSEPPPVAEAPPPVAEAPRPAVNAVPPLLRPQPVKKGSSKLVPLLIILFVLAGAGAGGFYLWQKQRLVALAKDGSQTEVEEEITDNDRIAALFGDDKATKKLAGAEIRRNSVSSAPPPTQTQRPAAAAPIPVTVTVAPTAPAPVAHPSVRFPPLRLQSIFYRPSSPSVIINGKTLFVSDEINGVIVADIQASSVTLVLGGQTNILTLR